MSPAPVGSTSLGVGIAVHREWACDGPVVRRLDRCAAPDAIGDEQRVAVADERGQALERRGRIEVVHPHSDEVGTPDERRRGRLDPRDRPARDEHPQQPLPADGHERVTRRHLGPGVGNLGRDRREQPSR